MRAQLPRDAAFMAYVEDLAGRGASDCTIAAALAQSSWAGSLDRPWHWRHVRQLRQGLPAVIAPAAATDQSQRLERNNAAAERARDELSTYGVATSTIEQLRAAGCSGYTIAACLNRKKLVAKRGARWSASSVQQVMALLAAASQIRT